jgi:ABC-2 type transport system ATP-binding protein
VTDSIVLRGLRKTFGPKLAVDDFDLVVPEGALVGFIGPNGAGKTTTIRMIMSILFPDSGELRVLGRKSALEAKDRIGYLPEERGVYRKMKVGKFLRFIGTLKGRTRAELGPKVDSWLERMGLAEVAGKRCEELSKGMQQKVQFIATVIHEPELLILDEPFSGLDPVNMRLLRDLVLEQHERGATIIFSTHVMVQAEQLCDQIVMIHQGRKVLDDSLAAIRAQHDPRAVLFEPLDPAADVSAVTGWPEVEGLDRVDGRHRVRLRPGADAARVLKRIVEMTPTARVEVHRPTLEDVFIDIVSGAGSPSNAGSTAGDPATGGAGLRAALQETPREAGGQRP